MSKKLTLKVFLVCILLLIFMISAYGQSIQSSNNQKKA
jgi:hypothetical protein